MRPPPASKTATMKVGAGQYVSSRVAITTLPMMPPKRAATMDMATPVALLTIEDWFWDYRNIRRVIPGCAS